MPASISDEVADRKRCQRGWMVTVQVDQLEPGEADDPRYRRPHPQSSWVAECGRALPARQHGHQPPQQARRRAPWVQWGEHVAQQHARDRQPDPEDHVDEGDREVRQRRFLGAVEAAVEDQREQAEASQAGKPIQRRRGSFSRRRRCCSCSCGLLHSVDSATNEKTSTIAAAQLNSQTGIGRFALPTIPCAEATDGHSSADRHRAPSSGLRTRRARPMLCGSLCEQPAAPAG